MLDVDRDKIRELWFSGAGLEAGKLIFEAIPVADTPRWAAVVLQLCCSQSKPPKEVATIYRYALRRRKWKQANGLLNKLSARTLKYERSPVHPDPLYGALLYVSEAVAKITRLRLDSSMRLLCQIINKATPYYLRAAWAKRRLRAPV